MANVMANLDALIAMEEAEANQEGPRLEGITLKQRRNAALKTEAEIKSELAEHAAKKEKQLGASMTTNATLGNMARNWPHYLHMAEEWELGSASIRKQKKLFEDMVALDKYTMSSLMTRAWHSKPAGCTSLRSALLQMSKDLLAKRKAASCAAEREGFTEQLQEIAETIKGMAEAQKRSKAQMVCPGAGGFRKQQQAWDEIRTIERRMGGDMDKAEKEKRWPCIQKGWPDREELDKGKTSAEIEEEAKKKSDEFIAEHEANAEVEGAVARASGLQEGAVAHNDQLANEARARNVSPSLMAAAGELGVPLPSDALNESPVEVESDGGGYDGPEAGLFDQMFGEATSSASDQGSVSGLAEGDEQERVCEDPFYDSDPGDSEGEECGGPGDAFPLAKEKAAEAAAPTLMLRINPATMKASASDNLDGEVPAEQRVDRRHASSPPRNAPYQGTLSEDVQHYADAGASPSAIPLGNAAGKRIAGFGGDAYEGDTKPKKAKKTK